MTQPDKVVVFVVGFLLGIAVGYIVRLLIEMKREIETLPHASDDENGATSVKYINSILLLIIVALTAWSAFQAQRAVNQMEANNEKTQIDRCIAGQDNRDIDRSLVEAIFTLATGSATRTKNSPPPEPEQIARYNEFIERANLFRSTMYSKIQPSEACEPYVTDEGTRPPTAPFPSIPTPKETPNG